MCSLSTQSPASAQFLLRKRTRAAPHAPTVSRLDLSNECLKCSSPPSKQRTPQFWSCNGASAHSMDKLIHTPYQNEPIKQEQWRWDGPSTSPQRHSLLTAGLAPAKGDWSFIQPRLGHPKDRAPPPQWGPAPGLHHPPGERAYPNARPEPTAQLVASSPLALAPGTPRSKWLCALHNCPVRRW